MASKDRTQVSNLCSKSLYLRSHDDGPIICEFGRGYFLFVFVVVVVHLLFVLFTGVSS